MFPFLIPLHLIRQCLKTVRHLGDFERISLPTILNVEGKVVNESVIKSRVERYTLVTDRKGLASGQYPDVTLDLLGDSRQRQEIGICVLVTSRRGGKDFLLMFNVLYVVSNMLQSCNRHCTL